MISSQLRSFQIFVVAVFTSSPRNLQTRWKPKDTKALLFTFLDLIGQAENVLYQRSIFLTWQVCSSHACTAISYIILHNLFSFCSLISLGYVDIYQAEELWWRVCSIKLLQVLVCCNECRTGSEQEPKLHTLQTI